MPESLIKYSANFAKKQKMTTRWVCNKEAVTEGRVGGRTKGKKCELKSSGTSPILGLTKNQGGGLKEWGEKLTR